VAFLFVDPQSLAELEAAAHVACLSVN
jgi:hypothetical protein